MQKVFYETGRWIKSELGWRKSVYEPAIREADQGMDAEGRKQQSISCVLNSRPDGHKMVARNGGEESGRDQVHQRQGVFRWRA